MTVIFIAEGHGAKNNACDRTYDGYLVAEFVFLMLLALADTLYLRLMNGIDFFRLLRLWERMVSKIPGNLS